MSQHRFMPQCSEFSCPLKATCSKVNCYVERHDLAEGDSIDVLFVGDSPSGKDFLKQLPFTGFESNIMKEGLQKFGEGLNLSIGFSLVVRGWSYDPSSVPDYMKNRLPTQFAEKYIHKIHTKSFNEIPKQVVATCIQFLNQDILRLKPKVIIAMGNAVATAMFPHEQRSISNLYNDLSLEYLGCPVRFISNPVAVLRNPSSKPGWINQLGNILLKKGQQYTTEGGDYKLLTTLKEATDYLNYLRNFDGPVAVDTETKNLSKKANVLGTIQFATEDNTGYVLPYNHPESPFTTEELAMLKENLYDLFKNPSKIQCWVAHNAKFECNIFAHIIGTQMLSAPIFDTQIGAFILDENRLERVAEFKYGPYSLKQLVLDYLKFDGYDKGILKVRDEGSLIDLPLVQLSSYAAMDAYLTLRLRKAEIAEAKKQHYLEQFMNLMYFHFTPVINLFCDVEQDGMPVNIEYLRTLLKRDSVILQEISNIERDMKSSPETIRANELLVQKTVTGGSSLKVTPLMGTPWVFDFAKKNHPQMLFYDIMNLSKGKMGKTGYSVDEEWQVQHKDVDLVNKYAEWVLLKKMFDSFVTKLYAYVDPSGTDDDCRHDSRIRPSFSISNVVTGRIACKSPNLQAVPRAENPAKKAIKNIFQAPTGQVMVQVDYKANEIRWVAIASKDDKMAENFNQGKYWIDKYKEDQNPETLKKAELYDDVHRQNAAKAFQKPIESITKDERQKAKGLNFGLLYDSTEEAVSTLYKIELDDVRRMFANFYREYDDILIWKNAQKQHAQDHSYVEAQQGRRRRFPVFDLWRDQYGFFSQDSVPREFNAAVGDALRQASNAPIQGIASDSGMIGAWLVSKYIRDNKKPWKLCNAVHDSLVLHMPFEDFTVRHLQDIEDCMTVKNMEYMSAVWGIEFNLPLGVDIEYGLKWGEMKKIMPVEKEVEEAKRILEEKMHVHN